MNPPHPSLPAPHQPSRLRRLLKRKAFTIPAGILLVIVLLDAGNDLFTRQTLAAGPLDTAAVNRIAVTGAASRIAITADPTRPFEAHLTGERSGWGAMWRSAWFASDCTPGSGMAIDAGTLSIDTGRAPYDFGLDDCTLTVTANVRPDAAVSIDQKAAAITLAGDSPASTSAPTPATCASTAMPSCFRSQAPHCAPASSSTPSTTAKRSASWAR